jgi:hypothetical protein
MSHNSDKKKMPAVHERPHFASPALEANGQASLPFRLTGSQAKTAFALRKNVEAMIAGNAPRKLVEWTSEGHGRPFRCYVASEPENLNCTAFFTLTVGDYAAHCDVATGQEREFVQVFDAAEASRRINNLNRRILPELFEKAVVVTERHKSGAIHFHIIGVLRGRPDIRTGFDFEAVARRDYRSVSPVLRQKWDWLLSVLPKYGFGRSELTPIRKTTEAVACYIQKYIQKNLFCRLEEDKRKKLVRYIGWNEPGGRSGSQLKPNEFSWGTVRACAWRRKARELAGLVGISEREEVAEVFGPRWAFALNRLMQGQTGENDLNPQRSSLFFIWDFAERERVKREVAKLAERACLAVERRTTLYSHSLRECNRREPGFCAPGRSMVMQAIRDYELREWQNRPAEVREEKPESKPPTFGEVQAERRRKRQLEARRMAVRAWKKIFPAPPSVSVVRALGVEVVPNYRIEKWKRPNGLLTPSDIRCPIPAETFGALS